VRQNAKKRPVVANYFKEALEAITGKKCPMRVPRFGSSRMNDENQMKLQDWCVQVAQPPWATGLSMIEAAELIVKGALENGNISRNEPEIYPGSGLSTRVKRVKQR
jgi:hypothetical protein